MQSLWCILQEIQSADIRLAESEETLLKLQEQHNSKQQGLDQLQHQLTETQDAVTSSKTELQQLQLQLKVMMILLTGARLAAGPSVVNCAKAVSSVTLCSIEASTCLLAALPALPGLCFACVT